MKNHPAADAFPMMDGKRYAELLADMKRQGQIEEITICDGMVLDGRNRYKACVQLGIEPKVRRFEGDPWERAWSLNGERRDLVDEQRYLIWKYCHENSEAFHAEKQRIADEANRKRSEAAKVQHEVSKPRAGETMVVGQSVQPPKDAKSRTAAVAMSKTNAGAVARGDKLASTRPDLAAAVRMGEMRPAEAHREMKREIHAESLSRPAPVAESGRHQIVLADPPWQYDHQSAENRAIENHYPTAGVDEIKKHSPETEDDAILFLWATAPKLTEAMDVMQAWGFRYVTNAVWDKQKIGMGYWFRGQHELLLVGVKGKPGAVPECERRSSVFQEARGKHSAKPDCVYEWIERAFPLMTKLEMYCRTPRKNWSAWGNES